MPELARAEPEPDACPDDAVLARLRAAGITAATIPDPPAVDPRLRSRAADLPPEALVALPAPPAHMPRPLPGDGLRLIPLEGFHWGGAPQGRDMLPSPRLRGDHALLLLTAGDLLIDLPRRRLGLMPGQLAFIPAGTAFALQPGAQVRGLALLIAPAHGAVLPLPTALHHGLPAAEEGRMLEAAMRALGATRSGDADAAAAVGCRMALIADALWRIGRGQGPAGPGSVAEGRALTEAFLDLARQNLAADHTLAELAGRLGCTQAQLDRACRQSRGRAALDLLYDLRLQLAAQALRGSTRTIADIALDLGFAGSGHFMRAFAAATGRTPQAYRDVMRPTVRGATPPRTGSKGAR